MPLVCQTSALTARPQRIPRSVLITYPSDSCVATELFYVKISLYDILNRCVLILDLKCSRVLDSCMFFGSKFHTLGPIE